MPYDISPKPGQAHIPALFTRVQGMTKREVEDVADENGPLFNSVEGPEFLLNRGDLRIFVVDRPLVGVLFLNPNPVDHNQFLLKSTYVAEDAHALGSYGEEGPITFIDGDFEGLESLHFELGGDWFFAVMA